MVMPALPEVEKAVDDLAKDVRAAPSETRLWNISGPPTGGKSTALRLLAARLADGGLKPLLIAPTARSTDAGPAALVEAAIGLHCHGLIDGKIDLVTSEATKWSDKLEALRSWIDSQREAVVILCDEPRSWPSTGGEDLHFAVRAEEVARTVLGRLACRCVVTGELPIGLRAHRHLRLDVRSAPARFLRNAGAWDALASEAQDVLKAARSDLDRRSPLEIRLLVAIVALSSPDDVARWWDSRPARRDISHKLANLVAQGNSPACDYLRRAWSRLALVRQRIAKNLLDRVAGDPPDVRTAALLHHCLLYPDEPGYTLHWTLRLDAREHREWYEQEAECDVHRLLAQHYTGRFQQARAQGDCGALREELEAFHHASLSGDDALLSGLRPFFAEQLDALGRTLSRDFKKYDEAAAVFERACRWEPEDDYAHHYLAYNLDITAKCPQDVVEHHYREALRLAPTHAWWHSRWINYLITVGRVDQAQRAYQDALDDLGLPSADADPWIYENLHLWVTRLLVHRGRLDFAHEVLRGIPPELLHREPRLAAIERRLAALVEARRVGAVFPLHIPPESWWDGPHLCGQRRRQGASLSRWMAGRVDAIDQDVHLQVAEAPGQQGAEPRRGHLTIPSADFDRWTLDQRVADLKAGQYLELAWYGDEADPLIRVHRADAWEDRDLPPLFPEPTRYLRAAGWASGTP